jgi:hypothetical protein
MIVLRGISFSSFGVFRHTDFGGIPPTNMEGILRSVRGCIVIHDRYTNRKASLVFRTRKKELSSCLDQRGLSLFLGQTDK